MENRQQQILSEIKSMMASVRSQLEILDAKMAEFQQIVGSEDFEVEPVDIDIEFDEIPEMVQEEEVTVQEIPLEEAEDVADEVAGVQGDVVDEDIPEVREETVEDGTVDVVEEVAVECETVEEVVETVLDEDIPESIFGKPEVVSVAVKAGGAAKPTINDMMADDCAWRHDMPGAPVKDIRSAISLNDRVIFINLLFDEDAQTFVNTLSQINSMDTLDQAVEYISEQFPSWDMNSDLVYRFMMAVRRKVR